jgi:hypothetical protein
MERNAAQCAVHMSGACDWQKSMACSAPHMRARPGSGLADCKTTEGHAVARVQVLVGIPAPAPVVPELRDQGACMRVMGWDVLGCGVI